MPEGRDVAQRRPLRVAVADGAARYAAARRRRRDRADKRSGNVPARRARSCTAPACSSRCRRSPAAARSCSSTRRASTPTRCGTRSSASACRCARSSATRSRGRCSPRSTPRRTAGISRRCARSRRRASRGARRRSAACSQHLPGVMLIDSLGASEGIMTRTETRDGDDIAPARFKASERVVVRDRRRRRSCSPATGDVGMLGVGGAIPLGYYKDPEKTRGHVPHRRRPALLDPRRLRDDRRRRHDPPARPRLGVHQHRRREGVPRRGRARAARRTPTCSTASSSASPTTGGARWSSRSSQPRDGHDDRRRRARASIAERRSPGTRCRSAFVVVDSLAALARRQGRLQACCASLAAERLGVRT